MSTSMEMELGTLIRRLNPYTKGKDTAMNFKPAKATSDPTTEQLDLSAIQLEIEGNDTKTNNYAAQWIFKGQAQNIVKAIRIKYHYPVEGTGGKVLLRIIYWSATRAHLVHRPTLHRCGPGAQAPARVSFPVKPTMPIRP